LRECAVCQNLSRGVEQSLIPNRIVGNDPPALSPSKLQVGDGNIAGRCVERDGKVGDGA
jgi:hypothetical protein